MDKVDFGGGGSPAGQRSKVSPSNAKKRKTARRGTTSSRGLKQGPIQRKLTTPSTPEPGSLTQKPQYKFFQSIKLYPTKDPIGASFRVRRSNAERDRRAFKHLPQGMRVGGLAGLRHDHRSANQARNSRFAIGGGNTRSRRPSPNLNEGKQYFEFFKAHVVRVAEDRRSPLIRELLYKSTYIMIASLLAIEIWAFATGGGARDAATVMLAQSSASYAAVLNGVINILGILGFALLGAVAGNLFFTLVRGRNVTFGNFDRLNPYRFSVNIHLTYLVLLVLVVLLTLYFNVITIGIGDLVLNKFTESAPLAIVIGLVCALAEATLVTLIQGRVQSIAPPTTK